MSPLSDRIGDDIVDGHRRMSIGTIGWKRCLVDMNSTNGLNGLHCVGSFLIVVIAFPGHCGFVLRRGAKGRCWPVLISTYQPSGNVASHVRNSHLLSLDCVSWCRRRRRRRR